ncbi:autotransporter outer membrane beta-barrel domain-containing protein [Pseudomonas sp. URMO17WK12:I12]|jgi:subtilase-type serine protease|uniref:autotransporter family protein n=1 Tax=Pseudomonas sp. URMO17WK12:I12 TaxID=1259797 RepID=UPI0004861FA1|nr:autotransporter outer membrane beta-barrel domain-containing protein [Pseudomonas sp. URMO17WK12:I12]
MSVQHKYRPHHLALAIALALGCTEIFAQQSPAESTLPALETPDQVLAALDAFIKDPDTKKTTIGNAEDGINRTFSDDNDLVTLSRRGSITGWVDGGGGTNFLQLDTASGGTLGDSRNFDGLELKRSTWTLNGSSGDFTAGALVRPKATLVNESDIRGGALTQGTLVNNGRIGGGVTVLSGGTLSNSGAIEGDVFIHEKGAFAGRGRTGSLEVNGKFSVGESHGAPKVKGDLKLSNTAELLYEVSADRKSETILVDGTAILGGATLNIVAAPGNYPLVSENSILVANNVEGKFGNVINNLAFLEPDVQYSERTVDLVLIRNDVPIESVADSENGRQFGGSLEEPRGVEPTQTSPDDTAPIAAPLNPAENIGTPVTASTSQATTPGAAAPSPSHTANAAVVALLGSDKTTAAQAIEQLAGGSTANLAKATLASASPVGTTVLSAMRQPGSTSTYNKGSNRRNAPSLAAGSEDNGRVWLQALGHGGTLDRDFEPLKHSTQGLVLGADWGIDDEWRIGVMGGKAETRLDSRDLDGGLDSWYLGAYALRQNGPMSLRVGATYGNHDGNTKRRVAFNGFSDRPEGRYDANTQQAFAEVGYNLGRANVSIEPFASLGYERYQRDTYTEKGGAAALKVHGQTQNNLSSTFGLRAAKTNALDNGMQLTPRFSASWKHTYGDVTSDTRQQLATGGRNYTVSGALLDRNNLSVDAGLDLGLSARHTLGVSLNGDVGTESRSHGVTGQWRMNF